MNNQQLKAHVKEVLTAKNIQKLPRTLASRLDDHASAEFFGLSEKMATYERAILTFCESLKAREFANLPETVKSDELPDETLKSRAVIHARRVRELSELRTRLAEKEEEVNNSYGRIPLSQRDRFAKMLVELQNVIAESA